MSELSAQNLSKEYHQRKVVKDFSIKLKAGEVVGLLGPNGAGKTTSFYMIVGLVSADNGSIKLDDTDLTHLPMHERAQRGISYLPQEASIFRKLTVADNIMAILELDQELSIDQRNARLEQLLVDFNLEHVRNTLGISLSGGERRRAEIARALSLQPKFILLDEPFAGVDPISVLDIKQYIHQLKALNIGVLITDHNVRETLDICDRGYIVANGSVIAEGDAETITSNSAVRQVYLGEDFSL